MIMESPEGAPMQLYCAVYRDEDLKEYKLNMYARSLSSATMSASELIPTEATLLRVYHNPDW